MGEKVIAETQYNDLLGTAAFDGHESPPVYELAECSEMPSESYWPVGFELFRLDPDEETGKVPFTLLAVKNDEVGDIEKLEQLAKNAAEIRVYRFHGELDSKKFPFYFKRIDIKVTKRCLKDANVVAYQPPDSI